MSHVKHLNAIAFIDNISMQYDINSDETESIQSSDDDTVLDKVKKINKKIDIKDAVKTIEERSLYASIDKYFTTECASDQIEKMIKIIEKEDKISLRLLNWFSMKHSASMEGMDIQDKDGHPDVFYVRTSYKARLKAHSKKYFDPFRRGKRFDYTCKGHTFETTLCQLNFFRWLIIYNLINYVEIHYETLTKKMAIHERKKKEIKNKKNDKTIKEKKAQNKIKNFATDEVKLVLTF